MKFRKATKEQSWLRLALIGPSGSGKTYTALTIGSALAERFAVIDTERGSASKYAGDVAQFEVLELDTFAPRTYVEALNAAAAEGFTTVVVDSLSHAWMGKDGALEQVDKAAAKSRSGNSFTAWREITPMHNELVDAILRYPGHVIVTMRAKTEWVLEENERGKKEPRKIGLAPVQRDGLEYEFDVVGDIDGDHRLVVSKSRCPALADAVIRRPGRDMAEQLKAWLTTGSDPITEALEALAAASAATLEGAKDRARRAIKLATNGRRQALIDAVAAAEARVAAETKPAVDEPKGNGGAKAPAYLKDATTLAEVYAWEASPAGKTALAKSAAARKALAARLAEFGAEAEPPDAPSDDAREAEAEAMAAQYDD